jgi:predicted RNA-binding Zn-ribbon protein involved in translation (DUF1610 family)
MYFTPIRDNSIAHFRGNEMEDAKRSIAVGGKVLACPHCGGSHFARRSVQLNTRMMSFLGLGWLNETASVFVCSACGHLEWFIDPQVDGEAETQTAEAMKCLSCGASIPAGDGVCKRCGWTYR